MNNKQSNIIIKIMGVIIFFLITINVTLINKIPEKLLLQAVVHNNITVVKLLAPICDLSTNFEYQLIKVDNNPENNFFTLGNTIFHIAAKQGNDKIFEILTHQQLNYRVNILNSMNYFGLTPLHYAAKSGSIKIVKKILNKYHDHYKINYINQVTSSGQTPLNYALANAHDDIAELLIKEGANVYYKDNNSNTMLHHAVIGGNINCVKRILNLEPYNIDIPNDYRDGTFGNTPLDTAFKYGHKDIVIYLIDIGAKTNYAKQINIAAKYGHVELVQFLLDVKKVNVNIKNEYGYTPLCSACCILLEGKAEMVELLLSKKADLNMLCEKKFSALDIAIHQLNYQQVKILLESGARTKKTNIDKYLRVDLHIDPRNDKPGEPIYEAKKNITSILKEYETK